MNLVTLIGYVVKDPNTKQLQNSQISRFTLAVRRDKENTDFIGCVAWGSQSEFASKWLKKGMQVGITGRIQTGKYTDLDGKDVYTTDIVVKNFTPIWDKKENNTANQDFSNSTDDESLGLPF